MPEEIQQTNFLPGHPLSYTTTRVSIFRNDVFLGTATAFIMKFGQSYALVTSCHVLSGVNPATGECLSRMGAIPNRIECHVTVSRPIVDQGHPGEELYFKPMSLNLFEDEEPIWYDAREDASQNDYAAIDLGPYLPELSETDVSLRSIMGGRVLFFGDPKDGTERVPVDRIRNVYPGVGTEVFVLGYPKGAASSGIFPIWKRGSVASEPQAPITLNGLDYKNAFYIDALTKAGMSGAPVICLPKVGDYFHTEDGATTEIREAVPYIIGVYAGRDGLTQEEYELSLGRVWKIGSVERLMIQAKKR
jgi:hypothetical protein